MKNVGIPALIKAVDKLGFTVIEVRQEQRDGLTTLMLSNGMGGNGKEENGILVVRLVPPGKQDNRPPGGYGGGGGGPAGGDKRDSGGRNYGGDKQEKRSTERPANEREGVSGVPARQ